MINKILVLGKGQDLSIALEFCSRGIETHYYVGDEISIPVGSGFEKFGLNLCYDFYTLLKSVPDSERDEWLILITDFGYGDLSIWLSDENFKVFGSGVINQQLGLNRLYGKQIMLEVGIKTPHCLQFETLNDVYIGLGELDFRKEYILKIMSQEDVCMVKGIPEELASKISEIDPDQRCLPVGYMVEEFIKGVEFATAAFFNGINFIYPIIWNFKSKYGGYLGWVKDCPIFNMSLKKMESYLRDVDYKGMILLNGIYTLGEIPEYYGIKFKVGKLGVPCSRIYFKMIKNLVEVLEAVAVGEDIEVILVSEESYFINAFSDKNENEVTKVGRIWQYEQEDSLKFGITFDRVIMDDSGVVFALPGSDRIFQMIGFGADYYAVVNNCLGLFERCEMETEFNSRRQEVVEDLRDRMIFLESRL